MKNILKTAIALLFCAGYALPIQAADYAQEPTQIYTDGTVSVIDYSDMIIEQENLDCGLHGLKNSIALFNFLTHTANEQERNAQFLSRTIGQFENMRTCRQRIDAGPGTLDPEAIYQIAKQLDAPFNAAYRNNKLLVLDNLSHPETQRRSKENKQLANIVEALQNGTPFVHALVLGNMDETGTRVGHWISCVIARDDFEGPVVLHMANSSGPQSHAFNKELGIQLMRFLNKLNPRALKFQRIQFLMGILSNNLNNRNYEAILINIRDIINEAVKQEVLTTPDFEARHKPALTLSLKAVPASFLTQEHQHLKRYLVDFLDNVYSSTQWNPPQQTRAAASSSEQPGLFSRIRQTISSYIWGTSPAAPAPQKAETAQPVTKSDTDIDALIAQQLEMQEIQEEENRLRDFALAQELATQTNDDADLDLARELAYQEIEDLIRRDRALAQELHDRE